MRFGAKAKPILFGLGATAILVVTGTALPLAARASDPEPSASVNISADPAPAPSDSVSPSDPPPSDPPPSDPPPSDPPPAEPSLSIRLSLSATTAAPGGSVTATIRMSAASAVAHNAVLTLSASSATVGGPVKLGDLDTHERELTSVVRIPASHGAGKVRVTASVGADRAGTRTVSSDLTVTAPGDATGTSLGAGGLTGGLLPSNAQIPLMSGALPQGQPNLPLIDQQSPAIAPGILANATPISLRADTEPFGLDPTLYRLVWTQVAWLSSLLVGLSLLLTQLRLNRHRALALRARRAPARTRTRTPIARTSTARASKTRTTGKAAGPKAARRGRKKR